MELNNECRVVDKMVWSLGGRVMTGWEQQQKGVHADPGHPAAS